MVYFRKILPTEHYLEEHEDDVPWHKVIELILTIKDPRKKGENFEIEKAGYYVLFKVERGVLFVINAKRT